MRATWICLCKMLKRGKVRPGMNWHGMESCATITHALLHSLPPTVYTNDNEMVAKNTQVVVRRVAAVDGKGLRHGMAPPVQKGPPQPAAFAVVHDSSEGGDDVSRTLQVVSRVAEASAVAGPEGPTGYRGNRGKGGKGDDERQGPKGVPQKLLIRTGDGSLSIRADEDKFNQWRQSSAQAAESGPVDYGEALPQRLTCPICKNIIEDAVVLQWAHQSACDK